MEASLYGEAMTQNNEIGGTSGEPVTSTIKDIYYHDDDYFAFLETGRFQCLGVSSECLSLVDTLGGNISAVVDGDGDGGVIVYNDGSAIAMGLSASDVDLSSDVMAVFTGAGGAYAVLRSNHTVECFGTASRGGDCSGVAGDLVCVNAVYPNFWAMAALRRDGSVVTWGHSLTGGDSSRAFCFVKRRGNRDCCRIFLCRFETRRVCDSLGDCSIRRDSTSVASSQLTSEVKAIYSSYTFFVAVKHNGSVVAWGLESEGGRDADDMSELQWRRLGSIRFWCQLGG